MWRSSGGRSGRAGGVRMAQAAAGDRGRRDTDRVLVDSARPRRDPRFRHGRPFGIRGHVVRGAVDEDAPAVPGLRVDLVDLEGDLILSVLDPGAQVLARWAILRGAEHDRPVVQLVVDRKHGQPETPGEDEPPDTAW